MAYVAELGYLDGHDHAVVDGDRVIQSIEGMERACFQEANRLVRIRMLGGVAGVRSNPGPYPDRLVLQFYSTCMCDTPLGLALECECDFRSLVWNRRHH